MDRLLGRSPWCGLHQSAYRSSEHLLPEPRCSSVLDLEHQNTRVELGHCQRCAVSHLHLWSVMDQLLGYARRLFPQRQLRHTIALNPLSFVTPELVQTKSFDGLLISRWLYLPDARKFPGKRPVIMDFYGGPESQSRVQFTGGSNYYLN